MKAVFVMPKDHPFESVGRVHHIGPFAASELFPFRFRREDQILGLVIDPVGAQDRHRHNIKALKRLTVGTNQFKSANLVPRSAAYRPYPLSRLSTGKLLT